MKNIMILLIILTSNIMLGQVNDSIADSIEPEEKDQVKMFVKEMPYYPFCKRLMGRERDRCTSEKIGEYISQNYQPPKKVRGEQLEGTTYVRFVVNKLGKVTKVEILRSSSHKILDKAALIAVKEIPDLIPATHEGKPVSIIYTIPVKVDYK
tara:strand:- start:249 stop:704 length:456 start_codon:yes stop_codon:yes gene_type:complete